ncbi:hypothetical protein SB748_27475 [Rhizobium sp. SIMBA_035]
MKFKARLCCNSAEKFHTPDIMLCSVGVWCRSPRAPGGGSLGVVGKRPADLNGRFPRNHSALKQLLDHRHFSPPVLIADRGMASPGSAADKGKKVNVALAENRWRRNRSLAPLSRNQRNSHMAAPQTLIARENTARRIDFERRRHECLNRLTQETLMADETTIETTATTEAPAIAAAEKKTRKPRTPKAATEASTVDATSAPVEKPAKKTRAKRGSKTAPVKPEKTVAAPKVGATRAPRVKAAASAPVSTAVDAINDIADLIKLEEENMQLRKQLSEKLRAENADLRKRLGKA